MKPNDFCDKCGYAKPCKCLPEDSPSLPVDKIVSPAPNSPEMLAYLLINALRNLTKEQLHNLATSLAVRDELFTTEEYEQQKQG